MAEDQSTLDQILERAPRDTRVVAQTVATCALSEFQSRWPEHAEDMAAVVCGRWLRNAACQRRTRLSGKDTSSIDRLINDCYRSLTDEQLAATERMLVEVDKQS